MYAGNGGGNADDCDPTDGPGVEVGIVTITRDGQDIVIEYDLNDPTDDGTYYSLHGIHTNLGGEAYAFKRKGRDAGPTLAPGQYNVKGDGNGENKGTMKVRANKIEKLVPLNAIFAIFHAEVEICTTEPVLNDPIVAAEGENENSRNNTEALKIDFKAYPVPFNNKVTIEYNFDFDTDVTIEVLDLKGRIYETITNNRYSKSTVKKVVIDMSRVKNQFLFVRVSSNSGSVVKKIVSDNKKW